MRPLICVAVFLLIPQCVIAPGLGRRLPLSLLSDSNMDDSSYHRVIHILRYPQDLLRCLCDMLTLYRVSN